MSLSALVKSITSRVISVTLSALLVVATFAVIVVGSATPANAVYATGGSGLYRGAIDWFEWGTNGSVIPAAGLTRTNTRTFEGKNLVTTCTLSNINGRIAAYASGGYRGDTLDNLYNIGGEGTSNQLVSGIITPDNDTTVSFRVTCSVTYDGAAVPVSGLVFGDAESINAGGQNEYIEATPTSTGATWRIIERAKSPSCATNTNARRQGTTMRLTSTGEQCATLMDGFGPAAIAFMDGANGADVTMDGGGFTAVAIGVVLESDFGDAPASYGTAGALYESGWTGGTLQNNQTTNVFGTNFTLATMVRPAVVLGSTIDAEGSNQASSGASADGTDEDALTSPVTISGARPGQAFTQSGIVCTGGSVKGWVDWDNNGTFDSDEGSNTQACSGGTASLTWTVPADAKSANTFMRLRVASNASEIAQPTGISLTGEVEDYAVSTVVAGQLVCSADTVFILRENGQIHAVAGDTGVVTPAAINAGVSASAANQLGIAANGANVIFADNPANNQTIREFNPVTGATESTAKSAGATRNVAGAVNPATGIYYYAGFNTVDGEYRLRVYGYDPATNTILGEVARIVPAAGASFPDGNGDIAFSATGDMFFVASSDTSATIFTYNQSLPTTAVTTPQAGTGNVVSTFAVTQAVNGIAYGGNGFLYISSSTQIAKVNSATGVVGTVSNLTLGGVALSGSTSTDLGSCATPSTVTVKASFPDGRNVPSDQVTVTLSDSGFSTSGTTTGSETGIQDQTSTEFIDGVPVISGSTYSVTSTGTGATNLNDYAASYVCTNTTTGVTLGSGNGSNFSLTMPTTSADVQCVVTFADPNPSIDLVKTASPSVVSRAGQVITYTFAVENDGNRDLSNLQLSDPMPGLSSISCSPVAIGATLAVGASTTCSATYVVTANDLTGTSIVNTATVTGTPPGVGGNPPVPVTKTGTSTVTVTTLPPVATDDSASTTPGVAVGLPGSTNDTPGEVGGPAINHSLTVFTSPSATSGGKALSTAQGSWAINPDGTVTFTPASGFSGTTPAVEYRITDAAGKTDTADLRVTVQPGPSASDDTGSTNQNVNVTVSPLSNDSPGNNANGTPATFNLASLVFTQNGAKTLTVADQGTYTINSDGTVTFDPVPGFTGVATPVEYSITNSLGVSATADITITVVPINPVANDDTAQTPFNTPVGLAGLTDDVAGAASAPLVAGSVVFPATGQPASVTVAADGKSATVTAAGTFSVNPDGSITFTPVASYVGTTPAVVYQISDANGTTDTATVAVTVRTGPNAAPNTNSTPQNVSVDTNVVANDTPGLLADGSAGSFQLSTLALIAGPAGAVIAPDGSSIVVAGEGTYTVAAGGVVSFDPEPGFVGTASAITYRVLDSNGNPASSTLTVTVTPINPVATDDVEVTEYNQAVTLDGATNDTAGAASAPIDATSVVFPTSGQPAGVVVSNGGKTATVAGQGVFTVNADGTVTFAPQDFSGTTAAVIYSVSDANGTADTATLQVTVRTGPAALPDFETTLQNVNVSKNVLENDTPSQLLNTDPGAFDADSLVLTTAGVPGSSVSVDGKELTVPGQGVYTVGAAGVISFDPEPGFTGTASAVNYKVTDTVGNELSSTLTITVTPINPVASDDQKFTAFNQSVVLEGATNDSVGDASTTIDVASVVFPATGQPLGVSVAVDGKSATVAGQGTFTVQADGTIVFAPVAGYVGTTAAVIYQVADSNGTTDTATVQVTVRTGPSAINDFEATEQGVPVDVLPLTNDVPSLLANGNAGSFVVSSLVLTTTGLTGAVVSADGKTLTVAGEGTYVVSGGTVTFTPEPAFTGTAQSVTYQAEDTVGNGITATITITVGEIVPTANDDSATTAFNQAVDIDVPANDTAGSASAPLVDGSVVFPIAGQPSGSTVSPDGKTLTVPGEGQYVVGADGVVTFTPETGFAGPVSVVTYQIADSNGTVAQANIAITIQPGPSAVNDTAWTDQNVNITVEVLDDDTPSTLANGDPAVWDVASLVFDPAGQAPAAIVSNGGKTLTMPGEGVYTVEADGRITFDPEAAFTGVATPVQYTITDSLGNSASALLTITVDEIVPSAVNDSETTSYNTPVDIDVPANDVAGDASAPLVPSSVVFTVSGQPAGAVVSSDGLSIQVPGEGSYSVGVNGVVTFTPVNFVGTTSAVQYQIADANGATATAVIQVDVLAAPASAPDSETTLQALPVDVEPLANDTGSALPAGGFANIDASTLRFADAGQPGGVLPTDGGATLVIPGEGTYTIAGGIVTFAPVPAFTGAAQSVVYAAQDELGNDLSNTISIVVTPIVPTATDDSASTPFNTAVSLAGATNDTPGHVSTVIDVTSVVFPAAGQPVGASIAADSKSISVPGEGTFSANADGTITFTPEDGFVGTTSTVIYQVADDNGSTDTAELEVIVRQGPSAQDDAATTPQNVDVTVDVLDNDTPGLGANGSAGTFDTGSVFFPVAGQPAGSVLAFDAKTLTVPGEGVYSVAPDGTITFNPTATFTGAASGVVYSAIDEFGNPVTAVLRITVTPVTPAAQDDTNETPFNTPVTTDVAANDVPGRSDAPIVAATVKFPTGQAVGVEPNGAGTELVVPGVGSFSVEADGDIVFTPEATFTGSTPAVTYEVSDANGTATTAELIVVVRPGPVAADDATSTDQGVSVDIDVLDNDTPGLRADGSSGDFDTTSVTFDVAGQPGGAVVATDGKSVSVPGEGTYTVNSDGSVTFAPVPSFTGAATPVTYQVTDIFGNSATATIEVTVVAINPVALPDAAFTEFNTAVTLNVSSNDVAGAPSAPLDTATVVFPVAGQPSGATVTNGGKTLTVPGQGVYEVVGTTGDVSFTPEAGFVGAATPVAYEISDANGTVATSTVTITVRPGPDADNDSGTTQQGVATTIDILDGDTPGVNADGSSSNLVPTSIRFSNGSTSITVPDEGTYVVDDAGVVTFTPVPSFTGTTTPVTYTVVDAIGNQASANISVVVTPVTPVAQPDSEFTAFQTPVTVDVLGNDSAGAPSAPLVPSTVVFPTTGQPGGAVMTDAGKTLTIANVGVFTVNASGNVEFDPADGFTGATPAVDYTVADENGTLASAEITVTVRPGPTALFDTATTQQNVNVDIDVLDNDTPGLQANGNPGTAVATSVVFSNGTKTITVSGEGTYTAANSGIVTFDPDAGFTGNATPVVYTYTDSLGNTASAEIRVSIAEVNPLAIDDSEATPFNTPVDLDGMLNDLEGAASAALVASLTVFPADGQPAGSLITNGGKRLTVPGEGVYDINSDGSVTFTPAADFEGTTTVVYYQIEDENGTQDTAELQVTVRPGPSADDDSAVTAQNVNVTIDILDGDVAGPNADLTPGTLDTASVRFSNGLTSITVSGEGTYTVLPSGAVEFDPEPSFVGVTTPVTYSVTDSHGNSASAQISVTVSAINPTAVDDEGFTPYFTPVTINVLANDVQGAASAPLDVASVVFTASGSATLTVAGEGTYTANADGTVTFTPEEGFVGVATSVEYQVSDTNGTSVTADIVVTVRPAPTADPESASTAQNVSVEIDVIPGDVPGLNADGSTGSFDLSTLSFPTSGQPGGAVVTSSGRVLTLPGVGVFTVTIDDTVLFDPEPQFTGTVPSIVYSITDSHGNTATAAIDVTVTAVVPLAVNDSAQTAFNNPVDIEVLGNDSEGAPSAPLVPTSVVFPDSGQPSGAVVTDGGKTLTVPGEGVYTVASSGVVTFTPADDFTGTTSSVAYEVSDSNGTTATAMISVVVRPGPVALPDSDVTPQNVDVTLAVLDNDTPSVRASGTPGAWDVTSVIFPADFTILSARQVAKPGSQVATAALRTAQPSTSTVSPDGKTLTMPGEGVYTVNPDGTVTFDPEPQFIGATSTIEYEVTDVDGNTVRTTIDITIVPGGEVAPDVETAVAGTPKVIPVLTNDTAPSGLDWEPSTVCMVVGTECLKEYTQDRVGTWVVNPDGTVTLTPLRSFVGQVVSTYYVEDTAGVQYQTTITVTVEPGEILVFTGAHVTQQVAAAISLLLMGMLAVFAAWYRRRRANA